jgi:hypothetical protein
LWILTKSAFYVMNKLFVCSASFEKTDVFKITAFWYTVLCSLIGVNRRFREVYCLHNQGDESSWSFITLMMEAVCTSETFVYSQTTRRYIPEGCHPHSGRWGNLKSHWHFSIWVSCSRKIQTGNQIVPATFSTDPQYQILSKSVQLFWWLAL